MRKLLGLSLVMAIGILGYSYFVRVPTASADESALGELEQRFEGARQAMELASRSAGATGLDTTADLEVARLTVTRVERDLTDLRSRLGSDSARRRAGLLQARIDDFQRAVE